MKQAEQTIGRKAVYAGSFDPITKGHFWMIEHGAKLFDELILAVGANPAKKSAFSLDERMEMLKRATRCIPGVKVDSFENKFLVNYAKAAGANYILRGIRTGEDYEYERGMRHVNSDMNPRVQTVFLMPPREISEVSSSLVKGLVGPEGWEKAVEQYLPRCVYAKFLQKFNGYLTEWASLWDMIGGHGDHKKAYDQLVEMYSEPHRHYHNLVHIAYSLREMKAATSLLKRPTEVETAIWFHDAFYTAGDPKNEEDSANLARKLLSGATSGIFTDSVVSLILATRHLNDSHVEGDAAVLADIDLAILGTPPGQFWEYEADITEEYGGELDNGELDEDFRFGRIMFLKGVLERQSIYTSQFFKEKYEDKARDNIMASISRLEQKKGPSTGLIYLDS